MSRRRQEGLFHAAIDIAAIDAGQWREFLRRIVLGFEHALRRKILENEPPF
jgi:hypothetical protein